MKSKSAFLYLISLLTIFLFALLPERNLSFSSTNLSQVRIVFLQKKSIFAKETTCSPLDEIVFSITNLTQQNLPCIISFYDGSNRCYSTKTVVNSSALPHLTFTISGQLGKHHIRLSYFEPITKQNIEQWYSFPVVAEISVSIQSPHRLSSDLTQLYYVPKSFLLKDIRVFAAEGRKIKGYRAPDTPPIWLRDHTYQMKGFKYFEPDMKNAIDCFLDNPFPNGSFLDYVMQRDDGKLEKVRDPVEADVEYLMVDAAYTIWQATGDDAWLKNRIDKLEKGLFYSMTDPWRWSKEYQMVKRPFTVDTWDIEYKNRPYDPKKSKFCIMHGDNSGMYQACVQLAKIFHYFKNFKKEKYWFEKANHFKNRVNKVCWNGRFYTHQIHIDPVKVPGVDEKEMLSLSNPYDINRGVASHQQAIRIIKEYQQRKQALHPPPFAEWFSIQPWFPNYSFNTSEYSWTKFGGEFINGGIFPLVGGELAKAAFAHGYETYGYSILTQYLHLIQESGKSYLWYHWDGRPGISSADTLDSDGWGSAAMMSAFIEGLAGIRDEQKLYRTVSFSPRWTVADVTTANVLVKYGASNGYFGYQYLWNQQKKEISVRFTGSCDTVNCHILLPKSNGYVTVTINNKPVQSKLVQIETSQYVDFISPSSYSFIQIKY